MGAVQPAGILRELDELWVSLGKQEGGEASTGVLRACAMTLVVLTEGPSEVGETLAALIREHPSRTIVCRVLDRDDSTLDAKVFAQCWMPFGRRQQICCEQIEISASPSQLASVPAVIRGLTVPDLPVVIWCRDAGLLAMPGTGSILDLAGKLVVNSAGAPDPPTLLEWIRDAGAGGRLVADLSWTRLSRWRETIAQVFENPACRSRLPEISEVAISYYGSPLPMRALYVAGWLKHALGDRPAFRFLPAPQAAFRQPQGEVQAVSLRGPAFSLSIAFGEDCAVELRLNQLVSRTVFPVLSEYELLREELSILGRDRVYEAALRQACAIARDSALA